MLIHFIYVNNKLPQIRIDLLKDKLIYLNYGYSITPELKYVT